MHGLRCMLATKLRRNSNESWVWRLQLMLTVDPSNEAGWSVNTSTSWLIRNSRLSPRAPKRAILDKFFGTPVFSAAVNPRNGCIMYCYLHLRLVHSARVSNRLSICYDERSRFNCYAIPEGDRYRYCAHETWWIFAFHRIVRRQSICCGTIRREYTSRIRMRQDPKINSTGLTSFRMLSWHVPDIREKD